MEPRAHHILIGLFTVVTAVAVMAFALWMGNAGSVRAPYDIVFEEDVKGLTEGSAVLYSGISVGEVASLELDPDNPSKVWTRVRIDADTPVRTSTTARMSLANITGASVILLETENPRSPPLKAENGDVPVIPSKPSPFSQLRTSGEELLVNVSQLVDNVNQAFSAENSGNLAKILANVEQTTAAFAGSKEEISSGIGDLAQASSELRVAVSRSSELLKDFNQQFGEHGGDLLARADQSLTSLAELSENLSALVKNNEQALTQSLQGMSEIGPTLTALEELLDNLKAISRELEANPSGYLFGGEKIQEYRQ